MNKNTFCIVIVALMSLFSLESYAETLVYESFNDQIYTTPLLFYNVTGYDKNIVWNTSEAHGNAGYCLQFDHSLGGYAGLGVLSRFPDYLSEGLYFRYWVNYSEDYSFPGDQGALENLKMFLLTGKNGQCIEFIYKSTSGGPTRLQVFWLNSSGGLGGTRTSSVLLGNQMKKGMWHKIEIFILIGTPSKVHIQIDDDDVYVDTNADIKGPASDYVSTNQFIAVRAGSTPPSGKGFWYVDDITIVHNEGDLCDNEPLDIVPAQPNDLKIKVLQ